MENSEHEIPLGNVQEFPVWKEAVKKVAEEFEFGRIIPHEWFWSAFGLEMPQASSSYAEGKKRELEFLKSFVPFQKELDEVYGIWLANKHSQGYEVVPIAKRERVASDIVYGEIGKAMRKGMRILSNTRVDELDQDGRNRHFNTVAKVSRTYSLVRKIKREPLEVEDANAKNRIPPRLFKAG